MVYVENGNINNYSTKFPYRIASNITTIKFAWKSNDLFQKLKYSLQIVSEDIDILPIIHIPLNGELPNQVEGKF